MCFAVLLAVQICLPGGQELQGCKLSILLVLLLGMSVPKPLHAWEFLDPDAPQDRDAVQGLAALHDSDFASARLAFQRYEKLDPDDPMASLLFLKLCWWGIIEGRDKDERLSREFESRFDKLKAECERRLKVNDADPRTLFILGEAYCAYGRLEGIRGHGWSTLKKHRKGTPLLKRALELQPDLVAPLSSLGVFHYYASRAPGFLRFLARFFSVEADRPKGLQQLTTAAQSEGMQQAEAAFFLMEVLSNVEDDQLRALPIALEFHSRYPNGLGFRISLAAVQVGMERPDAATALLHAATLAEDPHQMVASRFFLARALSMTGRAADAIAILESFEAPDYSQVEWLRAWSAYYLGTAYEQAGRYEDARHSYKATTKIPKVADSHGFAKRALNRHPGALHVLALNAESRLSWDHELDWDYSGFLEALDDDRVADRETRTRAQYAAAAFLIRKERFSDAVAILQKVAHYGESEEAWLMTRPKVRLLQGLLWSGRIEEARETALEWQPELSKWGHNTHLRLLIDSCLNINDSQLLFESNPPFPYGARRVTFRFKDLGFTEVQVCFTRGIKREYSMSLQHGYWTTVVGLPPGQHAYRFKVENGETVLDPAQTNLTRDANGLWSLQSVEEIPDL